MRRFATFVIACVLANPAAAQPRADATYADVAPILAQRCVMCHSGEAPPAGLRLDSFEAVLKGSARGPVVKAGAPAESELMRRILGTSQPRMPMTGPPFLSDGEIATFERWIGSGLRKGESVAAAPAPKAPLRPKPGEAVTYLHVAPIFAARCAKCHTDNGLMGPPPEGLRLTSLESTLAANEQGARSAGGVPATVPAGARVRLHGTLGASQRLDGLPLVVGSRARIDDNPRVGDYVQVRGRLDPQGNVIVERLRRRRGR